MADYVHGSICAMDKLIQFLAENPHIRYATPSSPDYADLRTSYLADDSVVPSVIVQPRSAEDIAALVPILSNNSLPFTVRVGGHDLFSRSQLHNGVTIDLRQIADVHVAPDRQTATLGGGIITVDLLKKLKPHGLITPFPIAPSVGYVGWATHGGYSPLNTQYGLGVDQIVAAKIVDAQGQIRDADETMLMAIRGAGPLVGVIVEMTIKVYELGQVTSRTSIC